MSNYKIRTFLLFYTSLWTKDSLSKLTNALKLSNSLTKRLYTASVVASLSIALVDFLRRRFLLPMLQNSSTPSLNYLRTISLSTSFSKQGNTLSPGCDNHPVLGHPATAITQALRSLQTTSLRFHKSEEQSGDT